MRCLVETVQRRQDEISETKDFDTERLCLGRGADQDIRLQSRLAGLSHAVIELENDGKAHIRAIAPNRILYNGKKLTDSVLTPGDEFSIGTVYFTVREASEGYDLRLEIKEPTGRRQSKELEDTLLAGINQGSRLSGFSMRRAAWVLSLAVVILFFVLPLAGFIYKPLGIWLRTLPVVSDLSWSPGPISSAHSFFGTDCNRCHQQAFVSVQNSACTDCHKDTPHHVSEKHQESIAALVSNRCASCHKEHNGSQASSLIRHDQALCTDCHTNIKAIAPESKLADVSDFGKDHPEFKVTIAPFADDMSQPLRIPLDQKDRLMELSNLEFSHALHLNKDGVKTPDRGKVRLDCANCHQPEQPGGKYMAKLDFESQCHQCHKLNFEAEDPKQEMPHGNDAIVLTFLEGYYSARALKGDYQNLSAPQVVRDRLRPGEELSPQEYLEIKEWAAKYARDVNSETMRFRVCGKCHTVSKNQDSDQSRPWKIQPLGFNERKLPKTEFDHDKHKTQKCTDCHDAEKSEHSEDVLLKGIADCRECHGGADAKNKVASTCIDCHRFHTSPSLTMEGKKIETPSKVESFPNIESPPAVNNVIPRPDIR
ncbi:MAG: cytochrome c3 family protein [Methylobacter sp.]